MEDICIKIPEDLKFVRQVSNIDWSLLVNKVIKSQLDKIARLHNIASKSQLSEEDVKELSDKINLSLSKRYL